MPCVELSWCSDRLHGDTWRSKSESQILSLILTLIPHWSFTDPSLIPCPPVLSTQSLIRPHTSTAQYKHHAATWWSVPELTLTAVWPANHRCSLPASIHTFISAAKYWQMGLFYRNTEICSSVKTFINFSITVGFSTPCIRMSKNLWDCI